MRKFTVTAAVAATVAAIAAVATQGPQLPDDRSARLIVTDSTACATSTGAPVVRAIPAEAGAMKKISQSGSSIYGYLAYSDEEKPLGFYELTTTGESTLQWGYQYSELGVILSSGWLKGDKLCALALMSLNGDQQLAVYEYEEFDLATGKLEKEESIDVSKNRAAVFITAAYVEEENSIYGYSMAADNVNYAFTKAPADNILAAKPIKTLDFAGERCYAMCYNPADSHFYGVTTAGDFVKIDKKGSAETIFNLNVGDLANTRGGLVYSPLDGYFVYNPQYYDSPSALYAIYPESKTVKLLKQFEKDMQFSFFITPDSRMGSKNPAMAQITSHSFTLGSHEAEVTYTMPSTLRDGSAIDRDMSWNAMVNGITVDSGTAAAGAEVKVSYTGLAQGECSLQFETSLDGNTGTPAVLTVYAGNDIPKAPANVRFTADRISWEAVTSGVHDAYIDAKAMTYEVYVNGVPAGTTPETSIEHSLDSEKEVSAYTATVIAVCNNEKSEAAISDKLIYGKSLQLPYTVTPTPEQTELIRIFNEDGGPDFGVWKYSEAWDKPCFTSGWGKDAAPDDWLILPPMDFPQTENVYSVSLLAARGGSFTQEYFEVWAGTSPEPSGMTIPVITKTKARSREWTEYENVFAVPAPGTYYIGVRCVSDIDQLSLIVREIAVSATDMKATMPAAVTNLRSIRTSDADLTATISFKLPATTLVGEPLAADTEITATATCAGSVSVKGAPGSTQQLTVPTAQGDNLITVTCEVDGTKGKSSDLIVFTGVDLPAYVENFQSEVSEDNMSIKFTWEAPVESLYGGYYTDKGITYRIGEVESDGSFIGDPVNAGTDVYEYTYTLRKGSPLKTLRIGIAAENAAGLSPARSTIMNVVGKPYSIPLFENFDNCKSTYNPLLVNRPNSEYNDGGWTYCQPELVNPAYANTSPFAIIGFTDEAKARVRMSLPKFSTENAAAPVITLELWTGFGAAKTTVLARTYGMDDFETIATIPAGDGWSYVEVVLPDNYRDKKWVTIALDGVLSSPETYLLLSSYEVTDGKPSGIDDAKTTTRSITATAGAITVTGYAGEPMAVHSLDGRLVKAATAGETTTVAVNPGIYVVTAGTDTRKLIVR